jgi:two-component sensor histidine kinase
VDLTTLLEDELAPYRSEGQSNIEPGGPPVSLTSRQAVVLGMAFHELATNAAKYGALSVPTGIVELKWEVRSADGGHQLHLRWAETGGPPVQRPTRTGFGLRLISEGLAHELDGAAQIDFESAGVRCTIDVPLALAAEEPK